MIARGAIAQLSQALVRIRDGDGTGEVVQWLGALAPTIASLPRPSQHDPGRGYSRTLLHRDDLFEILAIHWESNTVTPIHDHGGSHCWFAVTSGLMGVENFVRFDSGETPGHARLGLEGREELKFGGIDYRQDDLHLHRCLTRDAPAITLHVYARPLGEYLLFDERKSTCAPATSTYDAVLTVT